ncbi:rhomboid-like protein [Streptacidiphilus sp. N1-3]|uniref:Rhomboid-like protein n=1 Tax=Streptacidiphilus alkalitolerans TaxID=3342712 RepID=A0ABV6WUX6_9ACTN
MTTAVPPRPPAARSRPRRWAAAVARYVRAAPGSCLWLVILGLNTFAMVRMSPRMRRYFLFTHSTNLDQLRHHPIKVLITSAFWTETPSFFFWFLVFNLFLVPLERWLGTRRWLLVVVAAHVGATLVSEGVVNVLINTGALPERDAYALDIGVSYAVAGAVGMLTWFLARPLRWYYLGAATCFFVLLLISSWDFTNLGHITAFLIGVGCYPVGRGVPGGDRRPRWPPRGGGRDREKAVTTAQGATG